jgi:cysteine desulfurase
MPVLPRLYLDHAATTPMISAARAAMLDGLERWANPSSPHSEGRAARAALEAARRRIALALGWDGEIIFTSGASEAIAIGLSGAPHVTVSGVEHDSVLAVGANDRLVDDRLRVGMDGIADLSAISGPTCFAIQSANNETGVIQPLAEISQAIRREGGIWFADCSQSAGKIPLPDADMISVSAHKLGGPPGVGALLVRNLSILNPSGGQEKGYRRGTENLPAIMGFAAALESGYDWMEQAQSLRSVLDAAITLAGGAVIAGSSQRLASIASYHMPGVSSSSQLIGFDMDGIAVSAGSACSSGSLKTSHVLGAMGWKVREASEVVRVSFGPQTCMADIDRFVSSWRAISGRAKAA